MPKDVRLNLKSRRLLLRGTLVACGVALYFGSVFGVWCACDRTARRKTETVLDYACGDLADTWNFHFHGALSLDGSAAITALGTPAPRRAEEMRGILAAGGLSELHLVGRDGRIVSSADAGCVGIDLFATVGFEGLAALTNAAAENVDLPLCASLAGSDARVLYTGLPFRDGSFVLCGYREDALTRYSTFIGDDLMSTWQFGETGCYIVADENTLRIVHDAFGFGGKGKTLEEIGAGDVVGLSDDSRTTHVGRFFGEKCYFRHYRYLGRRILATIPAREFYDNVRKTTVATALIVLFVFVVLGFAVRRIVGLCASAKLRETVDAQRQKDLGMARSIQQHSLPSVFPPFPDQVGNIDIFAFMQATQDVGGDFYDFFFVGQDRLALVIADVSGLGIPAAMFMMRAKTAIQSTMKGGHPLSEAVGLVNRGICRNNTDSMFVSAWIGVYDLRTGELEYLNAGHIPPIVRRADGSLEHLAARFGIVMAVKDDYAYTTRCLRLMPGDELCLYTAGLTEATNAVGERYGDARLERSIRAVDRTWDARAFCDRIRGDYNDYIGGTEQEDDVTFLVFRVKAHVA